MTPDNFDPLDYLGAGNYTLHGPATFAGPGPSFGPPTSPVQEKQAKPKGPGFFDYLGAYFGNRPSPSPQGGGGGQAGGPDYGAPAAGAHEAFKSLAGAAGLTTGSAASGAAAGAAGGGASGILSAIGGF